VLTGRNTQGLHERAWDNLRGPLAHRRAVVRPCTGPSMLEKWLFLVPLKAKVDRLGQLVVRAFLSTRGDRVLGGHSFFFCFLRFSVRANDAAAQDHPRRIRAGHLRRPRLPDGVEPNIASTSIDL